MFKKIKTKLLFFFIIVGFFPMVLALTYIYYSFPKTIQEQVFNQLTSIRESRKRDIVDYFVDLAEEANYVGSRPITKEAFKAINETFSTISISAVDTLQGNKNTLQEYYNKKFYPFIQGLNEELPVETLFPKDPKTIFFQNLFFRNNSSERGVKYMKIHATFHQIFSEYKNFENYYNLYLIDNTSGYIIYSVTKETSFATNLFNGPYADTELGNLFKKVRELKTQEALVSDCEPFLPSYSRISNFIGSPILDDNGENIGTLIMQMPVQEVDNIMTNAGEWEEEGLGRTGEAYLVGEDFKMRSNSRFFLQNPDQFFEMINSEGENITREIKFHRTTILLQSVYSDGVKSAFDGKENTQVVTDYRGQKVLNSFTLIEAYGIKWALLAQMDMEEVLSPVLKVKRRLFILLLIATATVIILSFLVALTISKPVLKLSNATNALSQGELGLQIDIKSKDELGELAASFNKTSVALKKQREEILDKAERLDHANKEARLKNDELREQQDQILQQQEEIKQQNEELSVNLEKTEEINRALSVQTTAIDLCAIVAIADLKGNFIHANEKFCEISGYDKSELIGRNHSIVNSGFHQREFFKEMWRTIGSGNVWRGIIRNRRKNGEIYWVDTSIVPFLNQEGKPEKYLSIRFDITDRVIASDKINDQNEELRQYNDQLKNQNEFISTQQLEIKENEEKLNAILEAIPIPILMTNLESKIVIFGNSKYAEFFGYDREEVSGMSTPKLFANKEDRQKVVEALTQNSEVNNFQVKVKRTDGREPWISASGKVFNFKGKLTTVFGFIDISAEKEAARRIDEHLREIQVQNEEIQQQNEEITTIMESLGVTNAALREKENRLKFAMDSASMGAWDSDLEFTLWDEKCALMHGYPKDHNKSTLDDWFNALVDEDVERVKQYFQEYLDGIHPKYEVEYRIKKPEGGFRWILSKGALIDNEDKNEPRRMLGLVMDITERKAAEIAVLEYTEKIDAAFKDLQLTHEELKSTQNQLVKSEKMASLGQLTAGVAHEINNPVNFISGNIYPLKRDIENIHKLYIELVALYKSNPDKIEFDKLLEMAEEMDIEYLFEEIKVLLEGIEEGADRTAEIVLGLRSFARTDKGDFQTINIIDCIESSLTLLINKTKGRITIHKEFADVSPIRCMPGKMNQVFMNLFSNAIQAIEGKGDIFINIMDKGEYLKITVKDTGKGMSNEAIDKIFEPFFTTKKIGEGTGLGLSITHGIIEQHKGKIEVKSKIGEGTEFIILLPKK
ncbi:MAG: PAS domain S-box protein [Flammeovirgaceae bacterium]|nr:PAS domain S-box protein [Flammeovirgaceae bacterium]